MTELTLPEYKGNAFIEALGPPRSALEIMGLFTSTPVVGRGERSMPFHLRRHCAARILDWMQPRSCQVELADTIDTLLRRGYTGRDPSKPDGHQAAVLDAAERQTKEDFVKSSTRGFKPTSMGFSLIGHPGVGKSATLDRIVLSYPSTVRHELKHAFLVQVPVLKIDLPYLGSVKAFCRDVIAMIGRRVGLEDEYKRAYLHPRATVDSMTMAIQRLAQLHAIGLLVVDEIQHLIESRDNPQDLMNFLTTLANVHGISVVLVGTMGAVEIVTSHFRVARRNAMEPLWRRLRRGKEWDEFIKELWSLQWTAKPTPLSPEIIECMYDESQGVLDVAVKLFWVAQRRAIWRGEVGQDPSEAITVEYLRETATTNFHVIAPMIAALRENRPDHLIGFGDLEILRKQTDTMLASDSGLTPAEFEALRKQEKAAREQAGDKTAIDWRQEIGRLMEKDGYGPDIVSRLLDDVERLEPEGGFRSRIRCLEGLLDGSIASGEPTAVEEASSASVRKVPDQRRGTSKPMAKAKLPNQAEQPTLSDVDDLRFVAKRALHDGVGVHAALKTAGASMSLVGHLGRL